MMFKSGSMARATQGICGRPGPDVLCEFKGGNMSAHQLEWNLTRTLYSAALSRPRRARDRPRACALAGGVELEVAQQLFAARRNHGK
eukprot:6181993-Prymnesium_polylepis.1